MTSRKTPLRERDIERRLTQEVKSLGGLSLKWTSPGCAGVPDRIVFLPGGRLIFVEVKAAGGRLSPQQKRRIAQLKSLGQTVEVVVGEDGLESFIQELKKTP